MERSLAISTTIPLPFARCLALLRQALSRSGFRVLAEVPFDREFENHVGMRWSRYTVVLVWSPFHAYQAILGDQDAGILLPFHLIVAEEANATHVAATDVSVLGQMTGHIGLELLGGDISRKIQHIFSELHAYENPASPTADLTL